MAISDALRQELALPFGEVLGSINALQRLWKERPPLLVAVGDDTIYRLLTNGVAPDIGVFDLRCRRRPLEEKMEKEILDAAGRADEVENPPGEITRALSASVQAALMAGKGWIKVRGEDDLAALLFFASAPDGTVVLYGQPGQGMVWVDVDDATREKALGLLIRIRGRE